MPIKSSASKENEFVIKALSDCNKAIELDPTSGEAYFMRGQIEKMLQFNRDYCRDFLKARELGTEVEAEYLKGCKK
jgi:hypothetical protein